MAEESKTIPTGLVRHHASLLRTTGERDGVGDHSSLDREKGLYWIYPPVMMLGTYSKTDNYSFANLRKFV